MDKKLIFETLELAKKSGVQDARVVGNKGKSSSITIFNGELEKICESTSASLTIELFKDNKHGKVSTNKMDLPTIDYIIKRGCESLELIEEDTYYRLPDKELYFKGKEIDLEQFDQKYHDIEAEQKKQLAIKEAAFALQDDKIIANCTDYEDNMIHSIMADTNGFIGESSNTYYALSSECTLQGEGHLRSQGWWSEMDIFFGDEIEGIGTYSNTLGAAYSRAVTMLAPKKIPSGRYPVVIENGCASKVLSPIFSALNGGAIYQRNSFLLDSLGKEIFPNKLTIVDKPRTKKAIGARLFDNEGIATKNMSIIDKGVVSTYFINTYYAGKLNTSPTVDSCSVPTIAPLGDKDKIAMIQSLGTGVLITGFNGGNHNPSTGDFSFGIEGFFFKNGEICHPIKEMNMTGNIISLWADILHIGEDLRPYTMWRTPSLSFANVNLSGV